MVKQNMILKWSGLKEHEQFSGCIHDIILLLILGTEDKLYDVFVLLKKVFTMLASTCSKPKL